MSRYIDPDELLKRLPDDLPYKASVKRVLMQAPDADVVEVRHGEWIDKPTGAYCRMQSWCSACGKHSGIGGIESNRHKPYCPNCGAIMDGGKEQ